MEQTTEQTTQQIPDSISDLIRKCLALAESPNEFEAALAMSKAQELLLKYNLSIAQVKDLPSDDADLAELINCILDVDSSSWLRMLYNNISALNYCKVVGHRGQKKISVLGRMVNVQATIEMTQWLQLQMERLCIEAVASDFKRYSITEYSIDRIDTLPAFKRSFFIGIVGRVCDNLKELQNTSIASNNTARGLIVRLDQETMSYVNRVYPDRVMSNRLSNISLNGLSAGKRYADQVSIIRPSQSIGEGQRLLNGGS